MQSHFIGPDSVILWTVARQSTLSIGFSRQEDWSGLPYPTPEDLPDPGIEPTSFISPALAGALTTEQPGKSVLLIQLVYYPYMHPGI